VTESAIREILTELAARQLGLEHALYEGPLADHLDSIQRITLVVAIEDHFAICFDPAEEQDVETLADVVALIQVKLAAGESGD
jgi:acyl carrier protein